MLLLSLFKGNYKCAEQGGIFVWSFTHHLYSIQLVKRSSLILSLFHDSVEGLKVKTSSAHINYEIKELFGKSQARTKHKPSHFHSNSDSNIITSSLVINLVTWFADLFCDFAKELNKKARANTKNKRNIFTLSALRYEMADESVRIQGTTFKLCLFCPTTGKFRMSKGLCYE